jgi:hypothetical protein
MVSEVYCVFEVEEHVGLHLKTIFSTVEEARECVKELGRQGYADHVVYSRGEGKFVKTEYVVKPFAVYEGVKEWKKER